MAKISELKEMIVELEMDLIKATIPDGYCPYAFYPIGNKDRESIKCRDCDKCTETYFEEYEEMIKKKVRKL